VSSAAPTRSGGRGFVREDARFREWVTADGSSGYAAEPGRYHLYVSLACPWAHRTLVVRALKGLEKAIDVSIVDPIRDERGWAFRDVPGATGDRLHGWSHLSTA
jgi:glutathionyl-hydroquinone reductase